MYKFQLDEATYSLSVGSYVQSAYRFRIGYTPDACSEQFALDSKRMHEEYNPVFYRTCASNAPSAPSSPSQADEERYYDD